MFLENSTIINATPDRVWAITVDVENWPDWTPTVSRVTRLDDGPFVVGCVTRIKQPGMPACEWRVTELVEGEMFTWETRVRGVSISATHVMSAHGSGTKCVLRLDMKGLLTTLLGPIVRVSANKNLEKENAALKAVCESNATGASIVPD